MESNEIPKIIHYCWFGRSKIPKEYMEYIESWKKFFPNYKIVEWNENNFDLNCCNYTKEAYKEKKWAFVSDYVRFYVLYNFGGLYFDTDVEVIKPMDELLKRGAFMGLEPTTQGVCVAPGLGLAVNPGLGLYKDILDIYNSMDYGEIDENGRLKNVVTITTELLLTRGLKLENRVQLVDGIYIYPVDYFCPLHPLTGKLMITSNTRSIHHYSASWVNWETKIITSLDHKFFKYRNLYFICDILKFPFRVARKIRMFTRIIKH